MTDLEQLSALFEARGIVFKIEEDERFGKLLRTAPTEYPEWSPEMPDEEYVARNEKREDLAGCDNFYAVFQFDDDGKLLHVGAYE